MKKLLALAVVVSSLSAFAVAGGLELGTDVGAFYVLDVTGPAAGEKLCYRCRYGSRPVVSVFTRKVNDNVAALIEEVDQVVGKNQSKDMKAFVVVLTDEPDANKAALKKVADDKKVANTPLTTFEGVAGPSSYNLSKDSEVTVMMWVDGKLKVNETLNSADLTKAKISSVIGKTSEILN